MYYIENLSACDQIMARWEKENVGEGGLLSYLEQWTGRFQQDHHYWQEVLQLLVVVVQPLLLIVVLVHLQLLLLLEVAAVNLEMLLHQLLALLQQKFSLFEPHQ
jgi:hypothetical protein